MGEGIGVLAGVAPRCGICGSRDVEIDSVEDGGPLWLAECRHCDHRWTRRETGVALPVRSLQSVDAGVARVSAAA